MSRVTRDTPRTGAPRSNEPILRGLVIAAFAGCVVLFAATAVVQVLIARETGQSAMVTAEGEVGILPFTAVFFAFPAVGYVIARRQPSHVIGWLLLLVGLIWNARAFLFDSYLPWALVVHPGSLPAATWIAGLAFPLWIPAVGLPCTLLILLFPDGRLPPFGWRPLAWASAGTITGLYLAGVVRPGPVEQAPVPRLHNPFALDVLLPVRPALDALVLLLPVCMVACAVALVLRFRRSHGIERLQVKWLAASAAVVGCGYLVLMTTGAYAALADRGPSPRWVDVLSEAVFFSFVLIPAAVGIAVLKHGLYGIDRLISRTVSYVCMTGILLAVYLGVVALVSTLTPSNNSIAVAASTLAVAALFGPLRRRIQTRVDRRFNRSRYDAERTLESFSRRLRDEVDLDHVRADLMIVVRDSLQPESAGLWLRDPRRV